VDGRPPDFDASSGGAIHVGLPEPQPAPPPRKSGLAFFSIVLAVYALLGTLAQAANPLLGLTWSETFGLLLPAALAAAGSNLDVASALRLRRPPRGAWLLLAALIGVAGSFAAGALMTLTSLLFPARWLELFDVSKLFDRPPLERATLGLVAATLAPFCEEAAFRGWLLSALGTRHRPGTAIAISALLFALMHLDPVRFAALVGLGVLYGWLTWRAGSLWPAVVAHVVNNGLGLLLAESGLAEGASRVARASPREVVASSLLLFATAGPALALLVSLYRRAVPPAPPPLADALVRRDPANPDVTFRTARVPSRYLAAVLLGLATLVALAALPLARRR
jgi:uncharacterized protein